MGGVAIADPRLFDALCDGRLTATLALQLTRLQMATAEGTGHILALNDEYVWRRLTSGQPYELRSRLWVRCLACGARARLITWLRAAAMDETARARVIAAARAQQRVHLVEFIYPCEGADRAVQMLDLLTGWAGIAEADASEDEEGVPF